MSHHPMTHPRRARRGVLVGLAVATLATAGLTDTATAAKRYAVQFDGPGTYVVVDGAAQLTGDATGRPYDGSYVGTLAADDGSLPAAGECEPATASLVLDGPRRKELALLAGGDVCGQWVGPNNAATHVFTGRYLVESGRPRRLVGSEGFLEVRLGVDGSSYAFAIST
jgi:hypothetical protein